MASNSNIEWTDHTFNPWRGCTKISPGCAHCYAETMSGRNPGTLGVWGDKGTRVVASEAMWREPVKWDRAAEKAGERHRVFCASLADVFEDWTGMMVGADGEPRYERDGKFVEAGLGYDCDVPRPGESGIGMGTVRARLFTLIDQTPNLDWLLLTKRPENIMRMMKYHSVKYTIPRPNVWLGVSVEDRKRLDRIDVLRQVPAAVRFVSAEPLLEDLGHEFGKALLRPRIHGSDGLPAISWVIVGGESGPGARPCNVAHVRSIVQQCRAAGVACFVKQLGSNVLDHGTTSATTFPENQCWPGGTRTNFHTVLLRDKKGGYPSEWPADLRVREFPTNQPAPAPCAVGE